MITIRLKKSIEDINSWCMVTCTICMLKEDLVDGDCWGNGPAHVGVNGRLCKLDVFLLNIVSAGARKKITTRGL
jgi:hypothetical protein